MLSLVYDTGVLSFVIYLPLQPSIRHNVVYQVYPECSFNYNSTSLHKPNTVTISVFCDQVLCYRF